MRKRTREREALLSVGLSFKDTHFLTFPCDRFNCPGPPLLMCLCASSHLTEGGLFSPLTHREPHLLSYKWPRLSGALQTMWRWMKWSGGRYEARKRQCEGHSVSLVDGSLFIKWDIRMEMDFFYSALLPSTRTNYKNRPTAAQHSTKINILCKYVNLSIWTLHVSNRCKMKTVAIKMVQMICLSHHRDAPLHNADSLFNEMSLKPVTRLFARLTKSGANYWGVWGWAGLFTV